MKKSFILPFLIISFALDAQTTNNEYIEVDKKIAQFSNFIDNKVINELVVFINNNFSTETDKLRATFVWITNNFDYDIENMNTYKHYSKPQEVINSMLKNKKGICTHFAFLFSEIGNKLGLKTYVIFGYIKQGSSIDQHAWCASFIDSAWFLTDPTWALGCIQNNKFVKKQNNGYFKVTPEDLIVSHMPFDPLWQFLYYPVSPQEFYEGHTEINKEKSFFNYADTLKVYEKSSKIEQLISAIRRVEQTEKNTLASNQLHIIKKEKESYKNQISAVNYNSVVGIYNDEVDKLNKFIEQWNKKLISQKTEKEIKDIVKSIENTLISSQKKLQNINTTDISLKKSINQFKTTINRTLTKIKELNNVIDNHFRTKGVKK